MRSVAGRPRVRERPPGGIRHLSCLNGDGLRQLGCRLGLPELGTCPVQLQLDPLPLRRSIRRGLAPPGLAGEPLGVPRSGRGQGILRSNQLGIRRSQCVRGALPCSLRGNPGIQRRIQPCGRLAILGELRRQTLLSA